MENLVLGIITTITCSFGYYHAYRLFSKGKTTYALLLLMACGLMLRIYTATDFYLHPWDERYHALVAKNMIEHPFKPMLYTHPLLPYDFKSWAGNHVWLHKQPLPLWAMACSMSLFGLNEIALRLPSIFLTTTGIGLTFLIGKYLFNQKVGMIAAFLYSIHGLIIELTGGRVATDHFDIFFLFFIQLAVLLAIKFVQEKRLIYNLLCGICIGLAILSKWLPALIVLPIWLLLTINSKAFTLKAIVLHFILLIVVVIAISLPWQWYIHTTFPIEANWESNYNSRHLTEIIEHQGGPFYYYVDKLRMLFGELIYLPLIWFLWKSARRWRNSHRTLLAIWVIIPYLFFSFAQTKMQGYILFTAPAIFVITALFWQYLYQYRNKFRYKKLIYSVLFLLIALPVRYSIERVKPFQLRERNPAWVEGIKNLQVNNNTVLLNVDHPIEAMFYTNCIAYPGIPDINQIKKMIDSSYEVTIFDDGDLYPEILDLKSVKIVKKTGQ